MIIGRKYDKKHVVEVKEEPATNSHISEVPFCGIHQSGQGLEHWNNKQVSNPNKMIMITLLTGPIPKNLWTNEWWQSNKGRYFKNIRDKLARLSTTYDVKKSMLKVLWCKAGVEQMKNNMTMATTTVIMFKVNLMTVNVHSAPSDPQNIPRPVTFPSIQT